MRKLILMAVAGLAIGFAAPQTASAAPAAQSDAIKRAAAAIDATAEVQHWRWGSRGRGGHWRWGSGGHWRWGSRGGRHWRYGSRGGGHWRWGSRRRW